MQKIDDDIFDGQITKELKKNNLKQVPKKQYFRIGRDTTAVD